MCTSLARPSLCFLGVGGEEGGRGRGRVYRARLTSCLYTYYQSLFFKSSKRKIINPLGAVPRCPDARLVYTTLVGVYEGSNPMKVQTFYDFFQLFPSLLIIHDAYILHMLPAPRGLLNSVDSCTDITSFAIVNWFSKQLISWPILSGIHCLIVKGNPLLHGEIPFSIPTTHSRCKS